MSRPAEPTVSVVLSTYQRPEACERALRSALAQTAHPLEVIVCDDGSTDETEERMLAWEMQDPRVRYLRSPYNSGTPATTRNIGIEHARGELIAFLDDDDEWLPHKLATQLAAMTAAGGADATAANALRSDGSPYFADARPAWRPTKLDMMRTNPIITSTALVAREPLLMVGGFPTDLRVRGLEDYATWLNLASRGIGFLIIGEPLARYHDAPSDRLSRDRARIQLAMARSVWGHALRRPVALNGVKAALIHTLGVPYVFIEEASKRLRTARTRAGEPVDRVPRD